VLARFYTRTRTTVAVVVSRAINKQRETTAAVHISSHTHTHTRNRARPSRRPFTIYYYTSCEISYRAAVRTYLIYVLLFFLETRPKPNGPAKSTRPVARVAGMRLNIDLRVPDGRASSWTSAKIRGGRPVERK